MQAAILRRRVVMAGAEDINRIFSRMI